MAKAAPKKDPNTLAEVAGSVYAGIMAVFTFVVLAVFPLYYQILLDISCCDGGNLPDCCHRISVCGQDGV